MFTNILMNKLLKNRKDSLRFNWLPEYKTFFWVSQLFQWVDEVLFFILQMQISTRILLDLYWLKFIKTVLRRTLEPVLEQQEKTVLWNFC